MALWGGRFTQAADTRFKDFNDSLRFDYRLAEQDIVGSIAWSKALQSVNVLTEEEQQILRVLLYKVSNSGFYYDQDIRRAAHFLHDADLT